jgi:hypothetical protein
VQDVTFTAYEHEQSGCRECQEPSHDAADGSIRLARIPRAWR